MKGRCDFIVLIFAVLIFNFGNLWGQTLNAGVGGQTLENSSSGENFPALENSPVTVRASVLNGPSAIPALYLMERTASDRKVTLNQNIKMTFEKFSDPQSLIPKLIKNEIDVGFLPVNVAAKLYNSSNKSIVCAGITGNTNLTIITKDKNLTLLDDLEDKTVYIAGQGATPEYLFRWLLNQNNVSNVTLDYSIPPSNLPGQIIADKIQYAVVPEPFASIAVSKSNEVIYAIDLQEEFSRIAGKEKTIPFTVVVATKKFAQENPKALQEYISLLEKSIKWTNQFPLRAGENCKRVDIGLSSQVVSNAIPKSNYVFDSGEEAKEKIEELLQIFISIDKKAVGDSLPDSDFYFEYKPENSVLETEN